MSYGLRVWDANGVLALDIPDRLTSLYASINFTIDYYAPTVVLSVPGVQPSTHIAIAGGNEANTYYAGAAIASVVSSGVVHVTRSNLSYPDLVTGVVDIFRY